MPIYKSLTLGALNKGITESGKSASPSIAMGSAPSSIPLSYNNNNPYDYVGHEHNIALNELLKSGLVRGTSTSLIYSTIVKHFRNKFGNVVDTLPLMSEGQIMNLIERFTPLINNKNNSALSNLVTGTFKEAFPDTSTNRKLQLIFNFISENNVRGLINFENQLVSNNLHDNVIILGTSSVARNSMVFWNNNKQNLGGILIIALIGVILIDAIFYELGYGAAQDEGYNTAQSVIAGVVTAAVASGISTYLAWKLFT